MYLLIIILPLLGSIISGFFGRKVGVQGSYILTSLFIIVTTILAIFSFIEIGLNNNPVNIYLFSWLNSELFNIIWSFQFDSLTVSMLIPVLIISSLVHIYSIGYMSNDPHNQRFFSYLSLFTFMMIILVTGNNYLLMFVGWEGVGVCSYLLVNFWFTRIAANQSSISAFLTNRVGDCFLTIGMIVMLWSLGTVDYGVVFSLSPYINKDIITIIGILLLIGAMAKSSQIGLHVWLPMAMEGPTPVSALIHAATMVTAGVYLLIRSSPLVEYSSTVLLLCLWLGAITTIFSSLIGLFQQDIKKVIAYSTMSQLGMMIISIGLSSYNIALFHLINHAFYKGLLFLGAGVVIHAVYDNQDFRKYGSLIKHLPLVYTVMLIASLSLVAFPFLSGYFSKDLILESLFSQYSFNSISVYFISVIAATFTTLYSIKVLYLTFLTKPNGPKKLYKQYMYFEESKGVRAIYTNKMIHENNIFMYLPLIILAIFSVYFGYLTKDIFVGLGTSFFIDNSIFIHPSHEIFVNTEFSLSTTLKVIPIILTIIAIVLYLFLFEFISNVTISYKFTKISYYIFGFFNQRFLFEFFYNKYIVNTIFTLGNQTTKILDKGSIELIGPFGMGKVLVLLSKIFSNINKGIVPNYALFMLIGVLIYMFVSNIDINFLYQFISFILLYAIFIYTNIFVIINNKLNNNMIRSKIFWCNITLGELKIILFFSIKVIYLLAVLFNLGEFNSGNEIMFGEENTNSSTDENKNIQPVEDKGKQPEKFDSGQAFLNERMNRILSLMIDHTEKNINDLDKNLKEDDLYKKDDSQLTEDELKHKNDLLNQKKNAVDFLIEDLKEKVSLEDKNKVDSSSDNINKRNNENQDIEGFSSKKIK